MGSKKFITLAMTAVLLLGLASAGFAQSRFIVSSAPVQERTSGVTETAGDIVLTSSQPMGTGGTIPAGTSLTITIQPPTATITNDPVVDGVNITLNGMAVGGLVFTVSPSQNSLTISFTTTLMTPLNTILRIHGIRINDSGVGSPPPPLGIQAQLSVTPATNMTFDNVSIVTVSFPQPTLSVSILPGPSTLLQCLAQMTTKRVVITELYGAVFTSREQEAVFSNTPGPTNPTQVEVQIKNIPGGMSVRLPQIVDLVGSPTATAQLQLQTPCMPDVNITAPSRDITCTYQVVGQPDLGAIERTPNLTDAGQPFDVMFRTAGSVATQVLSMPGTPVTLQVHLSPTSATGNRAVSTTSTPPGRCVTVAGFGTSTAPECIIPRFSNDPLLPVPGNVLTVIGCTCNLKFPFVTNQVGFDTGIAIANTSMDPYGTAGQSGTVTLFFFGPGAPMGTPPGRVNTPSISGGATFAQTLSSLAPNFQGYIIAVANFQFCEGFAFIADRAFANIAHGYVAMVLPDPNQTGGRVPGFVMGGIVGIDGFIRDSLGERLLQ